MFKKKLINHKQILFILSFWIAVPSNVELKQIGKFKDWTAYSEGEGRNLACMAVSKPKKEEGDYKKRGEVSGGVRVQEIIEDNTSHIVSFDPNHPDANEEGYVYLSNVNAMNELVEMTAAARSFETNVEALNTAKQLMLRTVELLKK